MKAAQKDDKKKINMSKKTILNSLKTLAYAVNSDQEALHAIDLLVKKIKKIDDSSFKEEIAEKPKKKSKSEELDRFPLPKELQSKDGMKLAIFSDGACRGNPGPGSWGVLAQNQTGTVVFEGSGVDLLTTNNKMELEGAIWGLQRALELLGDNESCALYSDSKYVIDGISKWVPGWKQRNWKKADNKPPENLDQWMELDRITAKLQVKFIWVKGHAGHPQNEYCDQIANDALDQSGF